MLPSRRHLFQGRPCIFQQDNAKPHSAHITQVLAAEEEGTGTWLACLQSRPVSIRECVAHFEAQMRQRRPRTVAHLKTCCRKNGTKLHLKHFITWCLQSLNVFKCCEKEWQHYKVVNALLSQLFLECVASLNTGKDVYLQMTWSWPDKTWNILCSYCLQWNTSQSKFRNHYFLFLFAFSILSQLFLIWGCNTISQYFWSHKCSLGEQKRLKIITKSYQPPPFEQHCNLFKYKEINMRDNQNTEIPNA